jgi:hypothetical protein
MRKRAFLFPALLVFPAIAIAQGTVIPWAPTPPGLIETFLSKTPNAIITKNVLGVLVGPAGRKATFAAIVADDPSHPGVKIKGIEIEMEDAARELKIYLDHDRSADARVESLREFAFNLNHLVTKSADTASRGQSKESEATKSSSGAETTGAFNRDAGNPEYCCPRYTAFNAGWYRRGEELGVRIDDGGKTRNGFIVYFPNSRLSQVVDFVDAGKEWLDSN